MMENYKGIMLLIDYKYLLNQIIINLLFQEQHMLNLQVIIQLSSCNFINQLNAYKIKPILNQHKEMALKFQETCQRQKKRNCIILKFNLVCTQIDISQIVTIKINHAIRKLNRHLKFKKKKKKQQEYQNQQANKNELKDEMIDDQELNELLDFTKNLDYEQYLNDLEIFIQINRKRIEQIRIEIPQLSQKEATKKALKQDKNVIQKQNNKHVTIQEDQQQQQKKQIKKKQIQKIQLSRINT